MPDARYPDLYQPKRHHSSDVVLSSTADEDHAVTASVVNFTTGFANNATSPLQSICWTNCGMCHVLIT